MREPQDLSAFLLCALSKVCGPHRGACLPLSPSHSHSACVGDLWRLSPPAGERSSAGGRCETDRGPAPEKSCAHNPRLSLFSRLLCFPSHAAFLAQCVSLCFECSSIQTADTTMAELPVRTIVAGTMQLSVLAMVDPRPPRGSSPIEWLWQC